MEEVLEQEPPKELLACSICCSRNDSENKPDLIIKGLAGNICGTCVGEAALIAKAYREKKEKESAA